jgi:hypothetical protein
MELGINDPYRCNVPYPVILWMPLPSPPEEK